MASVTANGVTFNLVRLGDPDSPGPPVVLLHGIVIDNMSSLYFSLANPLATEFDVILYDLRGHGRSERPPTGYGVDEAVEDLAAILDSLGIDEPVAVIGNSFGGTVALGFAMKYPERTAGIGLVEAHYSVDGWGEEMATMLERIEKLADEALAIEEEFKVTRQVPEGSMPTLHKIGLTDTQIQFLIWWAANNSLRKMSTMGRTAKALVTQTSIIKDLREELPTPEADLRDITCPALLVYGENSDIIDRARVLVKLLPNAELAVMADADHSVLMQVTDALQQRLSQWLKTLPHSTVVATDEEEAGAGADNQASEG